MLPDNTLDTTAQRDHAAVRFAEQTLQEIRARATPLPGWPRWAEQVCQTCATEQPSCDDLARVLGMDADIAMRVIDAANSPLFARGARRLSDLHLAIRRLGSDNLRAVTLGFGLAQLRFSPRLLQSRAELAELWRDSTAVAAVARRLLLRVSELDAGRAVLAGLLHNLGKYCLLARNPTNGIAGAQRDLLLHQWHTPIGRMLAEQWKLPRDVQDAIAEQENTSLEQADGPQPTLRLALATALVAARAPDPPAETAEHLAAFSSLGMSVEDWLQVLRRAADDGAALRALLDS